MTADRFSGMPAGATSRPVRRPADDHATAITLLDAALRGLRRSVGSNHPYTLGAMVSRDRVLADLGDSKCAEAVGRQALEVFAACSALATRTNSPVRRTSFWSCRTPREKRRQCAPTLSCDIRSHSARRIPTQNSSCAADDWWWSSLRFRCDRNAAVRGSDLTCAT